MARYTATHHRDTYTAEIRAVGLGSHKLTIRRSREGKAPKVCFTSIHPSIFDALLKLEYYKPDLTWKEEQHEQQG